MKPKSAAKWCNRHGNILLLCPEVCQGDVANWKEPNMHIEWVAAYQRDRRKCQCQSQDPWQRWMLPMSQLWFRTSRRSSIQLKAQIYFVINSPDELCYPIWYQIWSKPHSLDQCIVPGPSQRVQSTLYMYQVTIYSSKCARSKSKSPGHSLHMPGHSSHISRCTRSEQTVQGTVKLHQV